MRAEETGEPTSIVVQANPSVRYARELVDHGATTVVFSRGRQGALAVPDETVEALRDEGVEVKVLGTDEAIAEYNRLAGEQPVGALIHSTC